MLGEREKERNFNKKVTKHDGMEILDKERKKQGDGLTWKCSTLSVWAVVFFSVLFLSPSLVLFILFFQIPN